MTTSRRTSPVAGRALLVLLLCFMASHAIAQTLDPHYVAFLPSPDHDAMLPDGRPMVDRYDLEFFMPGAPQPFQVLALGKPAVDVDGRIRSSLVLAGAIPTVTYEARVAAVGPSGSGESLPSNSFSFTGSGCAYGINPGSAVYTAPGGSGSLAVSSGPLCSWIGTSSASWVVVQSGASSGNSSLTFTVAANATGTTRTASLKVGNAVATISQAGVACTFGVSSTNLSIGAAGATGNVGVNAPTGCAWSASSASSWIAVGAASGSGTANLGYTVAQNTSSSSRTGSFTVAGTKVNVTQAGGVACTFGLSSTNLSIAAAGASGTVGVTAPTGCQWTASSASSWITVGAASGSGSANLGYTVAQNTSSSSRTGSFTVAGIKVNVTQAGAAACTYSLSAKSQSFTATGGSGSLTVTRSPASCSYTSVSNAAWITIVPPTEADRFAGKVSFTVAKNTTKADRTGTMTIAGLTFTVTQKR